VNTFAFQTYIIPEEDQQGIIIGEHFCLNIVLTLMQHYISKIAIMETRKLYEVSLTRLCKSNPEILELNRVKRISGKETFFLRRGLS
jgi:hypothetical protein